MLHISYLIIALLCHISSIHASYNDCSSPADAWLSPSFIHYASPEDLQLLANVLYVSWQRQHLIYATQESALAMLDQTWKTWYGVAYTRRNPSHGIHHDMQPQALDRTYQNFSLLYTNYCEINNTYDKMLTFISKLSLSSHLQTALDTLQYNSRLASMAVIQKALDLFNEESRKSGNLLHTAAQQLPILSSYCFGSKKTLSFEPLTILCALQAFATFDNKYVKVSDCCWKALLTSQQASNTLWHALANTRALFYKNHYHTVYTMMQKRGTLSKYFQTMFDEYGFVTENARNAYLPAPQEVFTP